MVIRKSRLIALNEDGWEPNMLRYMAKDPTGDTKSVRGVQRQAAKYGINDPEPGTGNMKSSSTGLMIC